MKWNVYKMFKNGKRAKAPLASFEHPETDNIYEYFESEIKKNFNEKNRALEFLIFRENEPQERKEEKNYDENLRKQTTVLNRLARELNLQTKHRIVGGLIFARKTNWKWQWCALQAGTNEYVAPLSPPFNNHTEADEWMTQQIHNLK